MKETEIKGKLKMIKKESLKQNQHVLTSKVSLTNGLK